MCCAHGKGAYVHSSVQVDRGIMRLYALLQLTNRQKQQLASRWRNWKSRRAALSSRLAAVNTTLDENLPSHSNANLVALLQTVDAVLDPKCESMR